MSSCRRTCRFGADRIRRRNFSGLRARQDFNLRRDRVAPDQARPVAEHRMNSRTTLRVTGRSLWAGRDERHQLARESLGGFARVRFHGNPQHRFADIRSIVVRPPDNSAAPSPLPRHSTMLSRRSKPASRTRCRTNSPQRRALAAASRPMIVRVPADRKPSRNVALTLYFSGRGRRSRR